MAGVLNAELPLTIDAFKMAHGWPLLVLLDFANRLFREKFAEQKDDKAIE